MFLPLNSKKLDCFDPKTQPGGKRHRSAKRRKTTLAVMEKRHVSGETVQTFQVVECKPSAQARYVGMFTVLQRLHLCLSDSLLVKAPRASVLAQAPQPSDIVGDDDPPHMGLCGYCFFVSAAHSAFKCIKCCFLFQIPGKIQRHPAKCNRRFA